MNLAFIEINLGYVTIQDPQFHRIASILCKRTSNDSTALQLTFLLTMLFESCSKPLYCLPNVPFL